MYTPLETDEVLGLRLRWKFHKYSKSELIASHDITKEKSIHPTLEDSIIEETEKPDIVFKDSKIISAKTGDVIATITGGGFNGKNSFHYNNHTGTIYIVRKRDIAFFTLVKRMDFHTLPEIISTISNLQGHEVSIDDRNLFKCFESSKNKIWGIHDSKYLNQFSDGIGVYKLHSQVSRRIRENENISRITVEAHSNFNSENETSEDDYFDGIDAADTKEAFARYSNIKIQIVFDVDNLTPLGLSILFWLLAPTEQLGKLM